MSPARDSERKSPTTVRVVPADRTVTRRESMRVAVRRDATVQLHFAGANLKHATAASALELAIKVAVTAATGPAFSSERRRVDRLDAGGQDKLLGSEPGIEIRPVPREVGIRPSVPASKPEPGDVNPTRGVDLQALCDHQAQLAAVAR